MSERLTMLGGEKSELSVEQQLELALKVMTKDQIENWKLEQALSAMEAKLNSMGVHNKIQNERIKEFVAEKSKPWWRRILR